MAKGMEFPLVGGAYLSRSLALDAQRCVNFYPVLGASGTAKTVRALFGTPGLRRLLNLGGTGAVRALYTPSKGGQAIAVQGPNVYRIAPDWSVTFVGCVDGDDTPVDIKDDGNTAVLVTGASGFTLSLGTNTLAQIVDEAFYGSDHICYTKTVFVLTEPNSARFYLMTLAGTVAVFDALDFALASSNAEPIIRAIVNHEELVLFKRTTTEIWRAVAGGDFLFMRDVNASIEKGCQAKHSVVAMDNTIFWLGGDGDGDGIVWRLNGYTPERVSHDGLEFAIQKYARTDDARAYTYQQEGHTFYVISFPTAGATWAYDVATGMWHERAWRNPVSARFEQHRGVCHMHYQGLHVVGDRVDGRLYALDPDCYDDDGDPLVALRSSPHVSGAGGNELRFNRLRVDLEAGVGLLAGQGVDPVLMLRWSNDGGRNWSSIKNLKMGRMGEYARRVSVDRLGVARDRVFEVSISDPVKRVILAAAVDAVDTGR